MVGNALISLFSLAGIWVLFSWGYSDYRNDVLKLRLFCLRDRLFDLALDGRVPFGHPAYGMLRGSINGLLLQAERISLFWVLLYQARMRKGSSLRDAADESEQRWNAALESLPHEARAELEDIRMQMNARMALHVMLSSPVFWLMIVPALLAIVVQLSGRVMAERIGSQFARAIGMDDLDFIGSSEECDVPVRAS